MTKKQTHRFILAIPLDLFARLKQLAEADERSVTQTIVRLLKKAVGK